MDTSMDTSMDTDTDVATGPDAQFWAAAARRRTDREYYLVLSRDTIEHVFTRVSNLLSNWRRFSAIEPTQFTGAGVPKVPTILTGLTIDTNHPKPLSLTLDHNEHSSIRILASPGLASFGMSCPDLNELQARRRFRTNPTGLTEVTIVGGLRPGQFNRDDRIAVRSVNSDGVYSFWTITPEYVDPDVRE